MDGGEGKNFEITRETGRFVVGSLLWRLVVIGLGCYFLVMLLSCAIQRSMIYYPRRESRDVLITTAKAEGMEPWIARDGSEIGWASREGSGSIAVVVFHGNAGNALDRVFLADRIRRTNPDTRVYILEYPGYGAREGQPSQASLIKAGVEAIESLSEAVDVILVGESLGTGVACQVACRLRKRVAGMILLTPFDSLVSVARDFYPWLPVELLMTERYDSKEALRGVEVPVVFVVAGRDEITSAKLGERLYEVYGGRKKLVFLANSGHNEVDGYLSDAQWREMLDFSMSGFGE